jgi:hypothetical protein
MLESVESKSWNLRFHTKTFQQADESDTSGCIFHTFNKASVNVPSHPKGTLQELLVHHRDLVPQCQTLL